MSTAFRDDSHGLLIGLRVFLFISSLPIIGAMAWTIAAHGGHSDPDVGGAVNSLLLAGSSFTCLWAAVALVVRGIFRTPIHPGIYVAFDLIAFLLLTITAAWVFALSAPFERIDKYNTDEHNTLLKVEYFACILAFVDCAVNLCLFVWACWATDKRRKEPKGLTVSKA